VAKRTETKQEAQDEVQETVVADTAVVPAFVLRADNAAHREMLFGLLHEARVRQSSMLPELECAARAFELWEA
jgi:hypothetical protein